MYALVTWVIICYYQNRFYLKSEILKTNTHMFFQENKCIWKCHLRSIVYFVKFSIIWNSQHLHTRILYIAKATVARVCWWPVTLPVLLAVLADDLGTIGLPVSRETVCAGCRKLSTGSYTIFHHMCKTPLSLWMRCCKNYTQVVQHNHWLQFQYILHITKTSIATSLIKWQHQVQNIKDKFDKDKWL